jgi:hypothetical protein
MRAELVSKRLEEIFESTTVSHNGASTFPTFILIFVKIFKRDYNI